MISFPNSTLPPSFVVTTCNYIDFDWPCTDSCRSHSFVMRGSRWSHGTSVMQDYRLSSQVAVSKCPAIREGDLPPSKVLKTSAFVVSLQKVAKESSDPEKELDFTLCTNITRSNQVLIITCKRLGYHEYIIEECIDFSFLKKITKHFLSELFSRFFVE